MLYPASKAHQLSRRLNQFASPTPILAALALYGDAGGVPDLDPGPHVVAADYVLADDGRAVLRALLAGL